MHVYEFIHPNGSNFVNKINTLLIGFKIFSMIIIVTLNYIYSIY